jgi:hypothetical protein
LKIVHSDKEVVRRSFHLAAQLQAGYEDLLKRCMLIPEHEANGMFQEGFAYDLDASAFAEKDSSFLLEIFNQHCQNPFYFSG